MRASEVLVFIPSCQVSLSLRANTAAEKKPPTLPTPSASPARTVKQMVGTWSVMFD